MKDIGSSKVRVEDGKKEKKAGTGRAVGGHFAWRNLLDWELWKEVGKMVVWLVAKVSPRSP